MYGNKFKDWVIRIQASRTEEGSTTIISGNVILVTRDSLVRFLREMLKYSERNGINDIGSNFWSKGRTAEIKDRVLHL